ARHGPGGRNRPRWRGESARGRRPVRGGQARLISCTIGNMTLLLLLALSIPAHAEELDAASRQGLADTQKLLADPKLRQEAISKDPNAAKVDQNVPAVMGNPANAEEAYAISSEIMAELVQQTGGDPEKLQK